jgi:hypothetical protein
LAGGLRERLSGGACSFPLERRPPPAAGRVCRCRGRVVLLVSLVPGRGWCAGLEDGSECAALGVGEGWGLSHEVLDVRGEAVRARPW